jgi:capsular polysaccharide biosynthesis protein
MARLETLGHDEAGRRREVRPRDQAFTAGEHGREGEAMRRPPPPEIELRASVAAEAPAVAQSPQPTGRSVVGVGRILRLLLGPVPVAAAGAYALDAVRAPVYAARSEIVFRMNELSYDAANRFLATRSVIARSEPVIAPVEARFGISQRELERNYDVMVVENSGVMRLEYRNTSPAVAADVAKALTERFLATLSEYESLEGVGHRVLGDTYVAARPVAPLPLRDVVLGALAGLVIGVAFTAIATRAWRFV